MEYKDYYQTFGVSKNASQDEIKKTYRKLARKHHPDVNPGDKVAEEIFKDINEAYEVLSDPEKRKKYDQFGAQWQQYERAGGRPEDFDWAQWTAQPGGSRTYTRTVSPEEFEQMFGGGEFSDFFETLFSGTGRQPKSDFERGREYYQSRPQRGRDSEQNLRITLEEAFRGTSRTLQWDDGRKIAADIPRGVRTGSRIRLSAQGESGTSGGQAGDLYLKIEVAPDSEYRRDGDDLRMSLPVDLYTTLLGGEVDVSTLDKSVKLSIPPETANGKIFRLSGLGMPNLRNPDHRGDLYATIDVQLPSNLSEKEKGMLEKLRELRKR
jgi:curved DNA-binding protein